MIEDVGATKPSPLSAEALAAAEKQRFMNIDEAISTISPDQDLIPQLEKIAIEFRGNFWIVSMGLRDSALMEKFLNEYASSLKDNPQAGLGRNEDPKEAAVRSVCSTIVRGGVSPTKEWIEFLASEYKDIATEEQYQLLSWGSTVFRFPKKEE